MSFTNTGDITLILVAKAAVPDPKAEDGWSIVDQLNLTLKSAADEKEYTFTLPVNEQTIAPRQLEEWQQNGTKVTVFCSAVRAQPFVHDTTKDKNGNPLKRYARPGKRVSVVGPKNQAVEAEVDAFVSFQAYDVRPAGPFDLLQEAEKAHGDFLKKQMEYRQRSIVEKQRKAEERALKKLEEEKAKRAAEKKSA